MRSSRSPSFTSSSWVSETTCCRSVMTVRTARPRTTLEVPDISGHSLDLCSSQRLFSPLSVSVFYRHCRFRVIWGCCEWHQWVITSGKGGHVLVCLLITQKVINFREILRCGRPLDSKQIVRFLGMILVRVQIFCHFRSFRFTHFVFFSITLGLPFTSVPGVLVIVVKVFCSVSKLTVAVTDVDQTRQAWTRGDPLELINLWCWSGAGCGSTRIRLCTAYSDSIEGATALMSSLCSCGLRSLWDNAGVLAEFEFPEQSRTSYCKMCWLQSWKPGLNL